MDPWFDANNAATENTVPITITMMLMWIGFEVSPLIGGQPMTHLIQKITLFQIHWL
jgi:hypothetical protein